MKSETAIALVLIFIVVIAGGSLAYIGSKFLENFGDWITSGSDISDTGNGSSAIVYTIIFKDGSTEKVNPQIKAYSILPLSIKYDHREVQKVIFETWVSLSWEGTLKTLEISGNLFIYHSDPITETETVLKSKPVTYGGALQSQDSWFMVDSIEITASEMFASLINEGWNTFVGYSELTVKATFEYQQTSTESSTASGYIILWITQDEITDLSIEVRESPF